MNSINLSAQSLLAIPNSAPDFSNHDNLISLNPGLVLIIIQAGFASSSFGRRFLFGPIPQDIKNAQAAFDMMDWGRDTFESRRNYTESSLTTFLTDINSTYNSYSSGNIDEGEFRRQMNSHKNDFINSNN